MGSGSLLERFVAGDKASETELVARVGEHGRKVAARRFGWEADRWREELGEVVLLLYRYREAGRIDVDRPLRQLARKLVKQVWRSAKKQRHRDEQALRWGSAPEGDEAFWDDRVDAQAQASAELQPRLTSPDAGLEARELLGWLARAAQWLSPSERETLAAVVAVELGEEERLAEALGVAEGTAYNRLCLLRAALRREAKATGARHILARLAACRKGTATKRARQQGRAVARKPRSARETFPAQCP
jgi:DNA-directed RNA polymerase specialized sigma24 family protein